ncbi:MAG: diguanylate cyclase [Gammaproteobacteria bacterium]
MKSDTFQPFLDMKATGRLPSPHGVALRLAELAQRPAVSIREVAHVLQHDPAMSARVVKLANSGGRCTRPIVAVSDAVGLLGLNLVRQVALGFALLSEHRSGKCEQFDYEVFWSRSLATALAARQLASEAKVTAGEECFTVGLLLEIGSLALATVHPVEFAEVIAESRGLDAPARRARERERFALDERELTAAMMADWGLPEVFIEAATHHEALEGVNLEAKPRTRQIAQLLALASHVAGICVTAAEQRSRHLTRLYLLGARLGLEEERIAEVFAAVAEQWLDWGRLLQVRTQSVPALAELNAARAEIAREPGVAAPERLLDGHRVLVVDDSATDRMVLQALLASLGYQVSTARDGKEALGSVFAVHPDIVITDWMMPEIDGLEFCRALRQVPAGRRIYVILLTAHNEEERLYQGLLAGADEFVSKPIRPREIEARLHAARRILDLHSEVLRDLEQIRTFNAELAVANRRLQEAALTDYLTSLPNRRYCLQRLGQEWAAVSRTGQPLSLLLIDIDAFKAVNDTHGHDGGDVVLQRVAARLRGLTRAGETVGRFGGEEFLVICPNTPLAEASRFAERVREAVAADPIDIDGRLHAVTVSIGVATHGPGVSQPAGLLKLADEALYDAKRSGRNRVSLREPLARG